MLDLACLVFGIIILVRGVVPLPWNKEVRGAAAYLVGLILVAVVPTVIVVTLVLLFDEMQAGGDIPPDKEIEILLYDLAIMASMVLMATLVALMNAQPRQPKPRRRRHADYDDYDEVEDERWDDRRDRDRRDDRY